MTQNAQAMTAATEKAMTTAAGQAMEVAKETKSGKVREARAAKLTEHDKRAARRVRLLWEMKKRQDPSYTQERAAKEMGWQHQANFAVYLTEISPIGKSALNRFCKFFGVKPWQIRPELADQDLMGLIDTMASKLVDSANKDPELMEVLEKVEALKIDHPLTAEQEKMAS